LSLPAKESTIAFERASWPIPVVARHCTGRTSPVAGGGRPASSELLNFMTSSAKELAEYREHLKVRFDSPLQPQQAQVDAAAAVVPLILRESPERDPYLPLGNPDPEGMIVSAPSLISQLAMRGHDTSVASWAIYRLIERGFLGAETAIIHVPKTPILPDQKPRASRKQVKTRTGFGEFIDPTKMAHEAMTAFQVPISKKPGPVYATRRLNHCQSAPEPGESYVSHSYLVVWPTDALWDWWKYSLDAALSVTEDRPDSAPKLTRDVPLPDTPGFRELYNKLASAAKEGKHITLTEIAREIAAKHDIDPATLLRALRRYKQALRKNGQ
jgi:hypothetical protein